MYAARASDRGHLCLLHPSGTGVSWHTLETIYTALVVPRSKTDSLDQPLTRGTGYSCGAWVPKPHFIIFWFSLPGGSLSGLLSHLFRVNWSQYLEDGDRRWAHLTYLLISPLDAQRSWRSFWQESQFLGPPSGIPDHSTSDSGKQEYGSVRGGWRHVMLGARSR